jgi:hypothetical protein
MELAEGYLLILVVFPISAWRPSSHTRLLIPLDKHNISI